MRARPRPILVLRRAAASVLLVGAACATQRGDARETATPADAATLATTSTGEPSTLYFPQLKSASPVQAGRKELDAAIADVLWIGERCDHLVRQVPAAACPASGDPLEPTPLDDLWHRAIHRLASGAGRTAIDAQLSLDELLANCRTRGVQVPVEPALASAIGYADANASRFALRDGSRARAQRLMESIESLHGSLELGDALRAVFPLATEMPAVTVLVFDDMPFTEGITLDMRARAGTAGDHAVVVCLRLADTSDFDLLCLFVHEYVHAVSILLPESGGVLNAALQSLPAIDDIENLIVATGACHSLVRGAAEWGVRRALGGTTSAAIDGSEEQQRIYFERPELRALYLDHLAGRATADEVLLAWAAVNH